MTTRSQADAAGAGDHAASTVANEVLKPGDTVGDYVIREMIGEGGFAVVYVADQLRPIKRRVALKMIKPGMDSKQIVARFASELQAMAMMEHPNIAKVLDAGTTSAGRAYFVMEYLPGEAITEYCDRHKLSTADRLVLFGQVCAAVQHAHQKGIIHRDIKPSNVLVSVKDDKPRVKVIDFGVAKAIGNQLTDNTIFTAHGQLIGTPEYMSPEQAEMGALDIDTRTDIYSLGVLLYELLVGDLPFDRQQLRSAAIAEIQRIIREVDPPKPSTRCSTMVEHKLVDCAQHRHTDPTTLRRQLRGDLDWITMKALEKDRSHRYASASEFAADVERYLRSEPVTAGPPSMMYKARKFVRRHRVGVGVGVLTVLLVTAGTAAFAWQRGEAAAAKGVVAQLIDAVATYIMLAEANSDHADFAASLTVYRDFEAIARAIDDYAPEQRETLVSQRIDLIMAALDATYHESDPEIIAIKSEIRELLAELEARQAATPIDPEKIIGLLQQDRVNGSRQGGMENALD